jgi:hypothetical protein
MKNMEATNNKNLLSFATGWFSVLFFQYWEHFCTFNTNTPHGINQIWMTKPSNIWNHGM